MPEPEVNIPIKATDQTASGFDSARSSAEGFADSVGDKLGALGKTIGEVFAAEKIKEFFTSGVEQFANFDLSLRTTEANLERLGMATSDSQEKLAGWAEEIQSTTLFTKDQAVEAVNRLVVSTGNLGSALKLSSLAMDVAQAAHVPLEQATLALGNAFKGNFTGLGRFTRAFPELKNVIEAGKDPIEYLEKHFSGMAEKLGNHGLAGELFHAKVAFQELGEEFAKQNAGAISDALSEFGKFTKFLAEATAWVTKFSEEIGLNLGYAVAKVSANMQEFSDKFDALMVGMSLALHGHVEEGFQVASKGLVTAENVYRRTLMEMDKAYSTEHISVWKDSNEKVNKDYEKAGLLRIEYQKAQTKAELAAEEKKVNAAVNANKKKMDSEEDSDNKMKTMEEGLSDFKQKVWSDLESFSGSHNKTMVEIAKQAGAAQAIIDTAMGVSNALAQYPYPLSLAIGALVGIEGGLEVAKIEGVSFAQGGIVTSPTMSITGDGNEPEAIVPLSKSREMGFGGGGQTTVVNNFPNVTNRSNAKGVIRTASRQFLATQNSTKFRSGQRGS